MQDRYAGDIGDYGKFGFLRALEQKGLSIGVNWYLTYPEGKEQFQDDGRYRMDRIPQKYFECDPELATSLCEISMSAAGRTVKKIENAVLLNSAVYYQKPVPMNNKERCDWHREALNILSCADIAFLDPDNGLIVESVKESSRRSVKYVLDCELHDYLERKQTVVFYQHRPRKKADIYFADMKKRIKSLCNSEDDNYQTMILTFPKYSVRDYFIVCPDNRFKEQISEAAKAMLQGCWGKMWKLNE